MSYPLIILGAGASMDYLRIDDHIERRNNNYSQYRSPLMNQLFDDSRFYEVLSRYPRMNSFASDAMSAMSKQDANFEDYLTNARDNLAENNPEIYSQLVSLIFYLAHLFTVISEKFYYERNHYKNLLQKIDSYCNGQACFVNFNYDLLLERSLNEHSDGKFNYSNLDSYISSNIKIIKIHGASNWRYSPQETHSKQTAAVDFFTPFAKDLILNPQKNQIYPIAESIIGVNFNAEYNKGLDNWVVKLPALALPLKNKPVNYVCDDSHIDKLKECIKTIDRILIIGWRGEDQFLLSTLKDELKDKSLRTKIVTSKTAPEEIIKKYQDSVPQLKIDPQDIYQDGFSEFMKTDNLENFLATDSDSK